MCYTKDVILHVTLLAFICYRLYYPLWTWGRSFKCYAPWESFLFPSPNIFQVCISLPDADSSSRCSVRECTRVVTVPDRWRCSNNFFLNFFFYQASFSACLEHIGICPSFICVWRGSGVCLFQHVYCRRCCRFLWGVRACVCGSWLYCVPLSLI